MLESRRPVYTDSANQMMEQLTILAGELSNISTSEGRLYSEDDCVTLKFHIEQLVKGVNKLLTCNVANEALHTDARRVLLKTWDSISRPTDENCRGLKRLADQVQGHGNLLARISIILISIIGFLAGIAPGFIFMACTETAYKNSKRHGLAKLTDHMNTGIESVHVVRSGRFFEPRPTSQPTPSAPGEEAGFFPAKESSLCRGPV